jgi:hypothetical protein
MKEYLAKSRRLKHEYGTLGILSALFGAFTFTTLAFLPILIVLGEIASLYLHVIPTMSALIWIVVALAVIVFNKLFRTALRLKKPDTSVDLDFLTKVHTTVMLLLVFVLGIVYLIWLMPLWF